MHTICTKIQNHYDLVLSTCLKIRFACPFFIPSMAVISSRVILTTSSSSSYPSSSNADKYPSRFNCWRKLFNVMPGVSGVAVAGVCLTGVWAELDCGQVCVSVCVCVCEFTCMWAMLIEEGRAIAI